MVEIENLTLNQIHEAVNKYYKNHSFDAQEPFHTTNSSKVYNQVINDYLPIDNKKLTRNTHVFELLNTVFLSGSVFSFLISFITFFIWLFSFSPELLFFSIGLNVFGAIAFILAGLLGDKALQKYIIISSIKNDWKKGTRKLALQSLREWINQRYGLVFSTKEIRKLLNDETIHKDDKSYILSSKIPEEGTILIYANEPTTVEPNVIIGNGIDYM